jgi:hypothetical protein
MSKHKWTAAEETALGQMHQARCSTAYMANQLGRTPAAIRLKLRRLRLAPVYSKDQQISDLRAYVERLKGLLSDENEAHSLTDIQKNSLAQDLRTANDICCTMQVEMEQQDATIKGQRAALAVAIVLATMLTAIAGWQGWRMGQNQRAGIATSHHAASGSLIGPVPVDPATGLELARFDMEAATDAPKAP